MTDPPVRIVPSVLPADLSRLGEECQALEKAGVDRIQWDVMDGRFVPNLTFGPDVVAACRPLVQVGFEAHLMVVDPDPMLAHWVAAGCELVILHAEACPHLHRSIQTIREAGAKACVVLNPATPASSVKAVLPHVDQILVMTVNPGFGGQKFIQSAMPTVSQLREWILEDDLDVDIEVDGGITADTIGEAAQAGANAFVAGTAVFGQSDYKAAIQSLQQSASA